MILFFSLFKYNIDNFVINRAVKTYFHHKYLILLFLSLVLLVISCEKEDGLPDEIQILNSWIWEGMNDNYLWERFIPNIDPRYEEDPEAYFDKLLYEDDRDSWIVDDYEALLAMFDGVWASTI